MIIINLIYGYVSKFMYMLKDDLFPFIISTLIQNSLSLIIGACYYFFSDFDFLNWRISFCKILNEFILISFQRNYRVFIFIKCNSKYVNSFLYRNSFHPYCIFHKLLILFTYLHSSIFPKRPANRYYILSFFL